MTSVMKREMTVIGILYYYYSSHHSYNIPNKIRLPAISPTHLKKNLVID